MNSDHKLAVLAAAALMGLQHGFAAAGLTLLWAVFADLTYRLVKR